MLTQSKKNSKMKKTKKISRGKSYMLICILIVALALTIVSASSTTTRIHPLSRIQVSTGPVPVNFTTYTEEGLFSISYPANWTYDPSYTRDQFENFKADSEQFNLDEEDLSEITILFLAKDFNVEVLRPNVNILIAPREKDYSGIYITLDELLEVIDQTWRDDPTPGYRDLGHYFTWIDGRRVLITVSEDNNPNYGPMRYFKLFTMKDEFMWVVTCTSSSVDFDRYKNDFKAIVKSFRILN